MKIRAVDIKPGFKLWTNAVPRSVITVETVRVFEEARSAIVPAGQPQAYLPGCVMITWDGNKSYSFKLDEFVERAFMAE